MSFWLHITTDLSLFGVHVSPHQNLLSFNILRALKEYHYEHCCHHWCLVPIQRRGNERKYNRENCQTIDQFLSVKNLNFYGVFCRELYIYIICLIPCKFLLLFSPLPYFPQCTCIVRKPFVYWLTAPIGSSVQMGFWQRSSSYQRWKWLSSENGSV